MKTARGGLDEHIWWVGAGRPQAHYVTVGFATSDAERFTVTRSRDRAFQSSVRDPIGRLCGASGPSAPSVEILMRTTLIRDESIVLIIIFAPLYDVLA